jgi:hypothetical protein
MDAAVGRVVMDDMESVGGFVRRRASPGNAKMIGTRHFSRADSTRAEKAGIRPVEIEESSNRLPVLVVLVKLLFLLSYS